MEDEKEKKKGRYFKSLLLLLLFCFLRGLLAEKVILANDGKKLDSDGLMTIAGSYDQPSHKFFIAGLVVSV